MEITKELQAINKMPGPDEGKRIFVRVFAFQGGVMFTTETASFVLIREQLENLLLSSDPETLRSLVRAVLQDELKKALNG